MTAKKTPVPDEVLTVDQVIAELGISRRTWSRWRADGTALRCVCYPGDRLLRVRRSALNEWLDERAAA